MAAGKGAAMTDVHAGITDDIARLVDREHDVLEDPYSLFERIQHADTPLVWSDAMNAYLVTHRDHCREIMRDTATWSNLNASGDRTNQMNAAMAELSQDPEMAGIFGALMDDRRSAPVLLAADPPEHRRQRHAVDHAFRPARIVAMEPMVQDVSDRLLDTFADRGSVEFVSEYGVLLPMEIIARALGVGDDDLLMFKRWSDALAMPVGNMAPTVEDVRSFLVGSKEFGDYFGEVLDQRMVEPQDDVISDVANAVVDGEPLTRAEQLSMCSQFLVAGNETTTKLLTNIAHYLAITPGLQERVTADRSLVDSLVEEVLRLNAPVQGIFRTATDDTTFHGVDVAKGSHVWLVYAAANRDESEYACPHQMQLDRENVRGHLAFGYGEHFCIGATLARLEARIATNGMLDRMPNIRIADGYEATFENSFLLRGMRTLDLEFDPT